MLDKLVIAMDTWARNDDGSIVYWNGEPQHRYMNGTVVDVTWVGYVWLGLVALFFILFLLRASALAAAGHTEEAKSAFGTALLVLCVGLMFPMILVLVGGLFHAGHSGKGGDNA